MVRGETTGSVCKTKRDSATLAKNPDDLKQRIETLHGVIWGVV